MAASFSTSLSDINTGLFGNDGSTSGSSSGRTDTSVVEEDARTRDTLVLESGRTDIKSTTESMGDSGQTTRMGGGTATTTNSGSQNTSTNSNINSGRTDTSITSGRTDNVHFSGREDVQQLMITQEGMNNMLRTILEGTQGLAATVSAQNMSGMYNSTANKLLTDDLMVRTAGYVAEKSAPMVTRIGASDTTTNIGAQSTLTNIGSSFSSGSATENIGGSTVTNVESDRVNTLGPRVQNRAVMNVDVIGPNNKRTTDTLGGGKVSETRVIGPSSTSSQQESEGLLDWIICTELYKQGKFGYRQYVVGSSKFATYDERIKRGYYIWAVPSVHHLRKSPDSKYSRFLGVWFRARAEHIMKQAGKSHTASWLNAVSYYGTHAFCWLLSRTVAAQYSYDSSSVYGNKG